MARGTPAAVPFTGASGSERTNRAERAKARRSSLRVRPGWEGKTPSRAGIDVICPGTRSGSSAWKRAGPNARSAATLGSSFPSPVGMVRASRTPMRAESSTLHGRSGIRRALNSSGSSSGTCRTWSIQALTPAVYERKRARNAAGTRASIARSSEGV